VSVGRDGGRGRCGCGFQPTRSGLGTKTQNDKNARVTFSENLGEASDLEGQLTQKRNISNFKLLIRAYEPETRNGKSSSFWAKKRQKFWAWRYGVWRGVAVRDGCGVGWRSVAWRGVALLLPAMCEVSPSPQCSNACHHDRKL
jgi:hypothetical protein